jgi:nucleotide-binding universal stress UspA family protein
LVFSRILVPYDGSKQSDNALEKAVELANLIRSNDNKDIEIILVQVVSEILMPTLFERLVGSPKTGQVITMCEYIEQLCDVMESNAAQMLDNKKQQYQSGGISLKVEALAGKPQDKIIQYAKNFKADLMIIGNIGQGNRISRTSKTLRSVSGVVS